MNSECIEYGRKLTISNVIMRFFVYLIYILIIYYYSIIQDRVE
jgi:hypothetical protein